jgi:hypothetical protein
MPTCYLSILYLFGLSNVVAHLWLKKGKKRRSSSHLIELMTRNVELFYDGSCHLISLLERIILKDSTVEIN